LALSYKLNSNKQATIRDSRHRSLIIPPLLAVLLFCFGFISASGRSHTTTASQTNKFTGQTQESRAKLADPAGLPALPASTAVQTSPVTPVDTAGTPAAPAVAAPTANNLQSAVPNNAAAPDVTRGKPLANTVKIVTDKLSF
jgi:hypothetical protein